MMSLFNRYLFICLLLMGISGFAVTAVAKELVFGVHPYLAPEKINQKFQPMVTELSKQLGVSVSLVVSDSYQSHVESVLDKDYDLAYLGPVSAVKVLERQPAWPLLARLEVRGKPHFQGKIIVRVDSTQRSIKDLVGKTFAFGNKSSTMSYLVPRYTMAQRGVHLGDFNKVLFAGGHDKVARAVIEGRADAGAVKEAVFFKNYGELKAIATTVPISEHVFSASPDLAIPIRNQISEILFNLDKSLQGRRILHSIKREITDIVTVSPRDYDNLKAMLDKYQND